ncbi:TPA: DUF1381 domain-containing protein [Staphylococcus aureus]|nr:DUF1381 domain-containing protein [Staphylococcus aureus]HBC4803774.1 DUF1381 domain-containing protein [Staphylococcus aureus]HBC4808731.1 DUF1381 domain-containing protein [Staphylococcus aureus]HDA0234050.1 DUF1381 domain-containing protein [Staphylococcus aureus]HDA5514759.1 DUF1381 domain-containing protein [Staphylococcus aureus]
MTQYLITTFTDSTGRKHNHVTKAKDNQTFTVVEAKSKEQAMKIYEEERHD